MNSDDAGTPVNYRDGEWHMMTATYDAATQTASFYGDGVLADQATVIFGTNLGYPDAPVRIGGSNLAGNASVQGGIDDVRIYSYALSPTEVAELYTDFRTTEYICVEDTENPLTYDLNGDCRINVADLALAAQQWLKCQRVPVDSCNW